MSNTSLNIVDVDFDTIKNNLKTYLARSDSPFKDYDFDGSNLSVMLDVMAYNTYLNSYYLNMVASEMFLDTAQLRDSIVSHAKELNYTPRSYRSAVASISFDITPSNPNINLLLVPKGTTFTSKVGSNNYSFATIDNKTFPRNTTSNTVAISLDVYEGSYLTDTFVFDTSNTSQRFVLSNYTIDTRTITVTSLENSGANVVNYTGYTSFLGVGANTNAYFTQGAENGQYEIIFGDGVKGRRPPNGSTIVVSYLSGSGELPNGARIFNLDGPIQGEANVSTITTESVASGGGVAESIESIRFNAPRYYQNQDRAITASDYESILLSNHPELAGASAYGGEDADPPVYGKVYVAVDLVNTAGASDADKERYRLFLKARSPISIDPVVIDPERLYVEVESTVRYNVNVTALKTSDIKILVETAISQYNDNNLNGFKKTLRGGRLLEDILNCQSSILGADLNMSPFKKFIPTPGVSYSEEFNVGFRLKTELVISADDSISASIPAVRSTHMTKDGSVVYIMDDGNGKLYLYTTSASGTRVALSQCGTVNYLTGKVSITNLLIDDYTQASGAHAHLYVTPYSSDITSTKNQILIIEDSDIMVTAVPESV